MINIWVQLQRARKHMKMLKKLGIYGIGEDNSGDALIVVDEDGKQVYKTVSFEDEYALNYADQCVKAGKEPDVLEMVNGFDDDIWP